MAIDGYLSELDKAADDPVRWAFITGVHLLEAGRASLLLLDNSRSHLVAAESVGIDPSIVQAIRVPVGKGIAGLVAKRSFPLLGSRGGRTFLSVPIIGEREVEGVLNLTNRMEGREYGEEHLEPTQLLASHIAHLLQRRTVLEMPAPLAVEPMPAFQEMLERELARSKRAGMPFAVVLVDVDNLEHIYRSLGQDNGDEVVHQLMAALQGVVRRYDFAGQREGNQFGLLLAVPSETDGAIAHRLSGAVHAIAPDVEIEITVGVARCPIDGTTSADLLARAGARIWESRRAEASTLEGQSQERERTSQG